MNIHTKDNVYKIKMSLSDIEKELDEGFLRCQRSFVVGLKHIKKTTKALVILTDDTEIPISRGMFKTINEEIIKYL